VRWFSGLLVLLLIAPGIAVPLPSRAEVADQSDWSGGDGVAGPVETWGDCFDGALDVSWLAVPGQLSLSSVARVPADEHLINDAYYGSFAITAGDVDGDGHTDVVGGADASGIFGLWLNQGTVPVTWQHQVIAYGFAGASDVQIADIDADGHNDVVVTVAAPQHRIGWFRNDGNVPITWTWHPIDSGWTSAFEVCAVDVDRDGHLDVLSAACENHQIAWWRNDGGNPVGWTRQTVVDGFDGVHSAWASDLDGDGDHDIVGAAAFGDEIAWWRNDGGNPIVWTRQPSIRQDFSGARSVRTADLDRDGDQDIVGTAWVPDVRWWRNDGGSWTEFLIGTLNGGHYVEIADVNGDGRLDVVVAAVISHDVLWFANQGGDPIVWQRHTVDGNTANTTQAGAADIDGDGALDVYGVSYYLGQFLWWEATDFRPAGELTSSILDTQGSGDLTHVGWSAHVPPGGELGVCVRSGGDPAALGDWSSPLLAPGPLAAPLQRYVQYRVELATSDVDVSPILESISFTAGSAAIGSELSVTPARTFAARPNPFNPQVRLSFELPDAGSVSLNIVDVTGRRVRGLVDGALQAGAHDVVWRGIDDDGRPVASGTYLAQLTTRTGSMIRKLTLLR
jgi:hypothetical protein